MRAAFYDTFGPPDVLTIGSIQEPELRAGDVLVQVVASGINPSDVKRRAGWRNAAWAGRRIVAHCDGAGIVVAAGDEAGRPWIGRRVWIWSIPGRTFVRDGLEYGTAAEYVPVPVSHLAVLPDGTDFATGACLGVPAITAHFTILADGPVAGQTVLVQAGGGAVGAIAVRIAREAGARVIATVRSAERAAIAREAGADVVVDLTDTEAERQVLGAAPGGVDRLIEVDFGANVAFDARVIATGGTIVSYSSTSRPEPVIPYYALQGKAVVIRLVSNYVLPPDRIREAVDHVEGLLERSVLRPKIVARHPLDDIAAAHRAVESGAIGKVVLDI